jgi:thioredoxin reductase (NADPH)
MAKPIIFTIDDEPRVLNAIERDLRKHYRSTYRTIKATSGQAALETVRQLKLRNAPVALFLVDQRMPVMSGTEFLEQVSRYYPEARKVLLTAYADTEAAITSINRIGLDYYLMKPWDPPDQNLYPVLDDLLSDWQANVELPYDGIRVAGTLWSATSHNIKEFLSRNLIPYQWLDIEQSEEARILIETAVQDDVRLPVVFFPDGSVLVQPDFHTLAVKAGMHTQASQAYYDLVIIGAGPAGLGAAVYAASEGMRTALIERHATGGQAGTSSRIENYLGFPRGVSGADLARRATAQARRLGAEILTAQEVVKIGVDDPYRTVTLRDGSTLSCKAIIIASGVSVKQLDVPGIEPLTGAGVYYGAAISEAALYRNRPLIVVGGANSAGQAAMFFSRYSNQVTMVVRASALKRGMSQYLVDQINDNKNIRLLLNSEIVAVHGERYLEAVDIQDRVSGEICRQPAAAAFIYIGAVPHTQPIADLVRCNRAGFVLTGPDLFVDGKRPRDWPLKRDPYLLETSVPGIFAVGDVRQGAVRRVASAVGAGAIAISFVHQYLKTV